MDIKNKLKKIVENRDNFTGRLFDYFIQFLIIISIITFSIETLPDLSSTNKHYLRLLEIIIVLIFTFEYLMRLYVADKKLDYAFSFYGLIDLASILPFYIASGINLRSLRILRVLRLFRTLKLFRYNNALARLINAFKNVKEEIIIFFFITFMLLFLSSVAIYYFENTAQPDVFKSVFHSFWWAVITLATVGYGDVYPITLGGRIFTIAILFIGLAIVAIPAGLLASSLTDIKKINKGE